MTIIDLANNDDASILSPIYMAPSFPPTNVIAPQYIFSNSDGGGVCEGWMLHQGGVAYEGGCESGWLWQTTEQ